MPREYYFSVEQQPSSSLCAPVLRFLDHTQLDTNTHTHTHTHTHPHTYTYPLGLLRYLHNTQQTQETNIQALNGIRTRDPSNRTAAYLCFRPHGNRDRPTTVRYLK